MPDLWRDPRLPERFWSKVRRESSGCWQWCAATNGKGYGKFFYGGQWYAHRLTYEVLVRPIRTDLQIDHLCRNRGCVNPDHLEAVTAKVNLARSETMSTLNARKTHCPQGHTYNAANTMWVYVNGGLTRQCRRCSADRTRAAYRKRNPVVVREHIAVCSDGSWSCRCGAELAGLEGLTGNPLRNKARAAARAHRQELTERATRRATT